jgi:hypothetical protein
LNLLAENNGHMRPRDILAEAEAAGFSRATVYWARTDLGDQVGNTKNGRNPANEWALAKDVTGMWRAEGEAAVRGWIGEALGCTSCRGGARGVKQGLGLRSRGLENGLLSTDSGNGLSGFVRWLDAGGRIVRPWG